MGALAEALGRTQVQLQALTSRVDTLTARVDALAERVDALTQAIGQMEERWGLAHETIARDLVPEILRRKGWKVLKAGSMRYDGEMDVVIAVEADGQVFTLATEVKGRVWGRGPMDEVAAKAHHPAFVAAAQREGFPEPIVPAVFGMLVYAGADEQARQAGVGLFSPYGEVVPPRVGR